MDLRKAIKSRQNIKRYSSKKPDWRKILQAIDMARFAPNAGNYFITKFILVDDPSKIEKISKACQMSFVSSAHYLVVAVSDDSKFVKSYGDRAYRYSAQQAGAAIQNLILALTEIGYATSWIRYYGDDEVKSILGISEKLSIDGVLPIGLPTKIKEKKPKVVDLENIIYFNKWGTKKMAPQTKVSSDGS